MFGLNLDITGELAAFFILAVCAITGAVMSLNLSRVIHSVLSLAFTFISLAGLYVLLGAEFAAFVQVLVYVGAVTILMIFGIMMTRQDHESQERPRPLTEALAGIGCLALFGILFFTIRGTDFPAPAGTLPEDNVGEIGRLIFSGFAIPFELMSVLLTVAFVGAVMLARREEDDLP